MIRRTVPLVVYKAGNMYASRSPLSQMPLFPSPRLSPPSYPLSSKAHQDHTPSPHPPSLPP